MLSSKEYQSMDAVGLADLARAAEISAPELLECALREIDAINPQLNAVVMRNDERSRLQAQVVDTSLPLAGVPFLAKDINVDIKHYRTTHACRFFADSELKQADSTLVKRWREAGLIIIGRTNTPEFATDFGCEPELYGPTKNPWDLNLTPGGSSGGAAAAVASGIVPMAHATDSGGSIRAPASCCGVFGFKPSGGLVATGSPLGHLVGGLNSDHVVTRSVRDSAAMLDVTAGADVGNPAVYPHLAHSYLSTLDKPLAPLRIGVTQYSPTGLTATTEICNKLIETTILLESLGHEVIEWEWPDDSDPCDVASVFWMAELSAVIDRHANAIGRLPTEDDLGPVVFAAWKNAKNVSSVDMVNARIKLRTLQNAMAAALENIDVLFTPVVSEAPLPTGLLTQLVNQDADAWMERAWRFAPYLEIFNVTGQPAMSVPLHVDQAGLPVGMHFVGSVGNDAGLLQLARQLEQASPWKSRFPPDHG